MQGLQALQKSRVVVTGNMSFVRKNQENQITKIKYRNILRNITTLAGKWKFKELKKVWSLTMEALNVAFVNPLLFNDHCYDQIEASVHNDSVPDSAAPINPPGVSL